MVDRLTGLKTVANTVQPHPAYASEDLSFLFNDHLPYAEYGGSPIFHTPRGVLNRHISIAVALAAWIQALQHPTFLPTVDLIAEVVERVLGLHPLNREHLAASWAGRVDALRYRHDGDFVEFENIDAPIQSSMLEFLCDWPWDADEAVPTSPASTSSTIQVMLGHADIRTTARYLNVSLQRLQVARCLAWSGPQSAAAAVDSSDGGYLP